MKVAFPAIAAAVLLAALCGCDPQPVGKPPFFSSSFASLGMFEAHRSLDLLYNKSEAIRKELLDPRLVTLMAKSRGFSKKQLASVRIAPTPGYDWVTLYQVGRSEVAFDALREDLEAYIRAWRGGHSCEAANRAVEFKKRTPRRSRMAAKKRKRLKKSETLMRQS